MFIVRIQLQLLQFQPILLPLPHFLCLISHIHKSPSTGPTHPHTQRQEESSPVGLTPPGYNKIGKPFNSPTPLSTTRPLLLGPSTITDHKKVLQLLENQHSKQPKYQVKQKLQSWDHKRDTETLAIEQCLSTLYHLNARSYKEWSGVETWEE